MLTESQIEAYKQAFMKRYTESVIRNGAGEFRDYLLSTDFFTAPASTKYHCDYAGGLAQHSYNVFVEFGKLVLADKRFKQDMESIAICGLLHDVCKANLYKTSLRNVKNDQTGAWEKKPFYQTEEEFPYGHGEKSVYLIQKYMQLTDEEAMVIRWHMGAYDDSVKGGSWALGNAISKFPLILYLQEADMRATYFDESDCNFPVKNI